ncbi:GAF domain-containing protein [Babesia caballi]|uniref:GAF domain-containing protein n=1 Tax=Babesia caballi TaxID=5871 RepID=A0AAV4LXM4_BABCB|nr:GAF domain-containing protein [Babesia caballi]
MGLQSAAFFFAAFISESKYLDSAFVLAFGTFVFLSLGLDNRTLSGSIIFREAPRLGNCVPHALVAGVVDITQVVNVSQLIALVTLGQSVLFGRLALALRRGDVAGSPVLEELLEDNLVRQGLAALGPVGALRVAEVAAAQLSGHGAELLEDAGRLEVHDAVLGALQQEAAFGRHRRVRCVGGECAAADASDNGAYVAAHEAGGDLRVRAGPYCWTYLKQAPHEGGYTSHVLVFGHTGGDQVQQHAAVDSLEHPNVNQALVEQVVETTPGVNSDLGKVLKPTRNGPVRCTVQGADVGLHGCPGLFVVARGVVEDVEASFAVTDEADAALEAAGYAADDARELLVLVSGEEARATLSGRRRGEDEREHAHVALESLCGGLGVLSGEVDFGEEKDAAEGPDAADHDFLHAAVALQERAELRRSGRRHAALRGEEAGHQRVQQEALLLGLLGQHLEDVLQHPTLDEGDAALELVGDQLRSGRGCAREPTWMKAA